MGIKLLIYKRKNGIIILCYWFHKRVIKLSIIVFEYFWKIVFFSGSWYSPSQYDFSNTQEQSSYPRSLPALNNFRSAPMRNFYFILMALFLTAGMPILHAEDSADKSSNEETESEEEAEPECD